ncbi:WD40/YVTN repeat-like-containing domain [Lasallia pustulata]|uniref:WD40/YVTN repeat-like-containing domain n=1 Tax=Lasallia pustulata TaxID=136370 RepID=A0A1W5DBZ9_9LECA|nr:WD40/YVTN repeat-like-containing domain [Lasallia pustulata]
MFSPEASVHASVAARNPRRRQRTGSDDSVAQRNPKKLKRTGLTQETFVAPPKSKKENGYAHHGENHHLPNGHAPTGNHQPDVTVGTTNLSIRKKGKVDRAGRGNKADGSIVLTKNDNYVVTQLPTTPERLCDYKNTERWHGEISHDRGYALAVTQTQAIVWRYTQSASPSDSSKLLTIRLPQPPNNSRHSLPLCTLTSVTTEPGFLVVMPDSGKITYWDTISSAGNEDPIRQKQQGAHGTIGGMMSREVVTQVTNAGLAGFVLTFSTGRVAHLTVRDARDRPLINVQYLRGNGASGGGLFGGLKNVFGGTGWKRDVATVKAAGGRQKTQRDIVVATTRGIFQIWDLNFDGMDSLIYEIDGREDLLQAIAEGGQLSSEPNEYLFEVLDFTFIPNGNEVTRVGHAGGFKLLVLTALSGKGVSRYGLVGLNIANGSLNVDVAHPISCYTTPRQAESSWRPQVQLPKPGRTAFIIFEKSIVLLSLSMVEESPESQLKMEAHTLPEPFQDTIDFRKDKTFRVVGCSAETLERDREHAACLVIVQGFGTVRIAALPEKDNISASERARVTAKTKIEQAVFYGSMQHNLLDFSGRPEITFLPEEVESAALELSDEIMKGTSSYIPEITPSMDHQLDLRSTALADLAKHLKQHYKPLSRLARWKLLWNAEKMAAARSVWSSYDSAISKNKGETTLLAELVDMVHEDLKLENRPERAETDAVRHWFTHDIWRIEYIIPWAQKAIEELYIEGIQDDLRRARLISEANDIQISALETAFKFREENAAVYALGDEKLQDGVLTSGFEDLPEFWTSAISIPDRIKLLVDLSRETAISHENDTGEAGEPDPQIIIKIAGDNPRQIQLCCQTYTERFRLLQAQSDPQTKTMGNSLKAAYLKTRRELFVKLIELSMADDGMALAEKYEDMGALVELLVRNTTDTIDRLKMEGLSDDEEFELREQLKLNEERTSAYFSRFGNKWANALFTQYIEAGRFEGLLDHGVEFQPFLTRFLRGNPSYAKIAWINEIAQENNYHAAAHHLILAQRNETNLWTKKVELSLCKLALLATSEVGQAKDENAIKASIRRNERRMSILAVQEQLYTYIQPMLRDALDDEAGAELVAEQCCKSLVKSKPTLRKAMERNLSMLVRRQVLEPEMLIDTLTLIDDIAIYSDSESFADKRFFLALKVLKHMGLGASETERYELNEKLIWRRCMIKDDWESINRTELKPDTEVEVETGATALFKTSREGFNTDLATEDAALAHQLEKGRLEMWCAGVVAAAQRSVRTAADEAGERKLRRWSAGAGVAVAMAGAPESRDWEAAEQADGMMSPPESPKEEDGEGDVVMG